MSNSNPLIGSKSKIVAALLALFLGMFGVHKFYLGRTRAGLITLACGTVGWILVGIPPAVVGILGLVEAIIYFTKSDAEFQQTYVVQGKDWL